VKKVMNKTMDPKLTNFRPANPTHPANSPDPCYEHFGITILTEVSLLLHNTTTELIITRSS